MKSKKIISTSLIVISISIVLYVVASSLAWFLPFNGRIKGFLIKEHLLMLMNLNNYSTPEKWIDNTSHWESGESIRYADKTLFGAYSFRENGEKVDTSNTFIFKDAKWNKQMWNDITMYAEAPQTVLYKVAPFAIVKSAAISVNIHEAIIYFSTTQGDFIYFKDFYVEDKEYVFPIDEAYKVSAFFEENNIVIEDFADLLVGGKFYPQVDEYEGIEEFEVRPLDAIYYIKSSFGFVIYSLIVLGAVTVIYKKKTKNKEQGKE